MKVLFVSYGGGHIEMCLPVIKALREQWPGCEVRLMALTTAFEAARSAGESPLSYRDFCDQPDAAQALAYGEQLLPEQPHPAVSREESQAYLGFNFLEWVKAEGEAQAWVRWHAYGRHGFLPIEFFRRVLLGERPDVVVTTNAPRSEAAALVAAAELDIPSVSMVDLFALPGDPFLARVRHADRIAVLCEATHDHLVAAGVPAARIVITGNPAFDELSGPQVAQARLAWRQAQGWENLRVVLWAGHREPADADPRWAGTALGAAVQDELVRWVLQHPGAGLIVRYHPNEFNDFDPPPPHPRIHWSRPDKEALLAVLAAADDVVVQISTTGVQAAVAGKRVINLGFSPFVLRSGMDFSSLGLAVSAPHLEDLAGLLDAGLASGPGCTAALAAGAWMGPAGGAAAAVAQIVCELAADGKSTNNMERPVT